MCGECRKVMESGERCEESGKDVWRVEEDV